MTANNSRYDKLANAERNLVQAEKLRDEARAEIIEDIKRRLGEITPYAFAKAADINWGNFHRVLTQGEWNAVIISQVLTYLDGAPIPPLEAFEETPTRGGGGKRRRPKRGGK